MTFVVDASAAVEYLLLTPLGRRVAGLLEGAALVAPELLDAEVVTADDALYVAAARRTDAALGTADGPLSRAPALGVVLHNVRLG
jgi:predicted nucleic acid-binding protein